VYVRVHKQGLGGALVIDAHRGGVKSDLFFNDPECESEREIIWRDRLIWPCRAHNSEEGVGVDGSRRGTERMRDAYERNRLRNSCTESEVVGGVHI
jgi:hypothetical protein